MQNPVPLVGRTHAPGQAGCRESCVGRKDGQLGFSEAHTNRVQGHSLQKGMMHWGKEGTFGPWDGGLTQEKVTQRGHGISIQG